MLHALMIALAVATGLGGAGGAIAGAACYARAVRADKREQEAGHATGS